MPQNTEYDVYFVSDAHMQHFQACIKKFHCRNSEYTSTCYLAAYPAIFKCFSLRDQEDGPFDWYFEYLEAVTGANSNHREYTSKGDIAPLTGQTTALVRLALNLWNGREFDLSEGLAIWNFDLYKIALQAIDLRRSEPILNILHLS